MAIKDMIAAGIGFNPGSVKYVPTRGLVASIVIPTTGNNGSMLSAKNVRRRMTRGR